MDRSNGNQHTIAQINMYVELPHDFRGTHMSRFIEILNIHRKGISTKMIPRILSDMKEQLDAERSFFEIRFPYFITKEAPVSKQRSKMEYIVTIYGDSAENSYCFEVKVPVISLCPCSREISEYGAHNQRSYVKIKIKTADIIWIEDLVEIAEKSASGEIYPLLKREDEKYITEKTYQNPMFVEDIVRCTAEKLQIDKRILFFEIESENIESIHNHSAYARIISR